MDNQDALLLDETEITALLALESVAGNEKAYLDKVAADLVSKLYSFPIYFQSLEPHGFKTLLSRLSGAIRIEFVDLDSDAAFELTTETNDYRFNTKAAQILLASVDSEVAEENASRPSDQRLGTREISRLKRDSIQLFLLHELSHVHQGLAQFETVQIIKDLDQPDLLGQLDVIADRNAAVLFAGIHASHDPETFLAKFEQALYLMGNYAFPAFKFPREKKHKVSRALGLCVMLSRIVMCTQRHLPQDEILELLVPLYVYFGNDSILVLELSPTSKIVGYKAGLNETFIQGLTNSIGERPFKQLLAETIALCKVLDIV
jgi:hypothetical protein